VEEAKKALEDLSGTVVLNAQLQNLFNAVKEHKAPMETVFGQLGNFLEVKEAALPPAPPADEAKTAVMPKPELDELTRTGPPIADRDFGKKKKKKDKGWRRTEDFESTTKWTEPIEPAAGGSEETTKWEQPPAAAPPKAPPPPVPAAPAASFGATTIGKIEDVAKPKAPPAPAADFGATTIGKVEDVVKPPKPPAAQLPSPPASFTATTVVSPDKVKAPPAKPPLLDDSATRIGRADEIAKARPPVADFGATTIGKIEAPVKAPPPPAPPAEKKEKRKEKLEERAAAPAIAVPREEVAPKKSSMGMIIGGVAGVVVIAVVLYFVMGKKSEPTQPGGTQTVEGPSTAGGGTSPTSGGGTTPTTTPPPVVAPPVDPWTTPDGKKIDALLKESRRLSGKADFAGANKKLDDAEKLGPEGVIAEAIRTERASIKKASEDSSYREAVKRDNDLLNQIATLRQQDTEDSLNRALGLVNSGISSNGPRAGDFRTMKPEVESRISFVRAEGTRRSILEEGNGLARRGDYAAARAKARELQSAGGDATGLLSTIQTAEQAKKSQLDNLFDRNKNNAAELEKLVAEYRKLAYDGGPFASDARDMAENRIPAEVTRIRAPKPEPPVIGKTPTTTTPAVSCSANFRSFATGPDRYTGPLAPGRLISDNFVDGGIKLQSSAVPPDVLQGACGKSVRIRFDINEGGKVTGGTVITGDAGLGKQIIALAQRDWQFNAPKVSNVAVKTNTTYQIDFK
jgi:hypothetical protein